MSVLAHEANLLNGQKQDLNSYQGKVVLVVNTASKCGFTPQYEGLEKLYKDYQGKGLEILGFPCNQFGAQEPGGSDVIEQFCRANYGVSFPMFEKVKVNGDNAHPFYKDLKAAAPGMLGLKAIKWNFTKFLINRRGEVTQRYAPTTTPEQLATDIEKALGE